MLKITVNELTGFLNKVTNGFSCPICRHQNWQVEQQNGCVNEVKLQTEREILDALCELNEEYGGKVQSEDESEKTSDSAVLSRLSVVRCGHCGWIALFDSSLIKERIND